MNRCLKPRKVSFLMISLAWALACFLIGPTESAQAQVKRAFPYKSEPAKLEFTASARQLVVNGRAERTGPGLRVYDPSNRLVFANRLQGQTFEVQLRRGPGGLVQEVWILNPAERADPKRLRQQQHTPMVLPASNLAPSSHDPAQYLN